MVHFSMIIEKFVLILFVLCIVARSVHLLRWVQIEHGGYSSDGSVSLPVITKLILLGISAVASCSATTFILQWTISTLTFLWMYEVVVQPTTNNIIDRDVLFAIYIKLVIILLGNLLGVFYTFERSIGIVCCNRCRIKKNRKDRSGEVNSLRINMFNAEMSDPGHRPHNGNNSLHRSGYYKGPDRDFLYP